MANRLEAAAQWLTGVLKEHAGTEVVYCRGAERLSLTVTLDSQLLRLADHAGQLRVERTELDLLIPAADLILDGGLTTPLRGDTVEVTAGDVTKRFLLAPPGQGSEPAWRYTDPHQTMIRAHFKLVGEV